MVLGAEQSGAIVISQVVLAAIAVVIVYALVWQTLRAILSIRMDATGTRFRGIHRKYSVRVSAGYVEGHWQTVRTRTTGNRTASYNDLNDMVVVRDTRTKTHQYTDHLVLNDGNGHSTEFAAVDVRPSVLDGHLVSVATLSKGSKRGNSFLVFNHSTDLWWLEKRGDRAYKHGFVWMSNRFTIPRMIFWILLVVTIPWLIATAWMWQFRYNRFKKKGVQPLLAAMRVEAERARAAAPTSTAVDRMAAPLAPAPVSGRDVASQLKDIAALHASGALSDDEFQSIKAELLRDSGGATRPTPAPRDDRAAMPSVGWHLDANDPTVTRYWDGTRWIKEMRWDGSRWA